ESRSVTAAIPPHAECDASTPSRLDPDQRILRHGHPPGLDPETPRGLEEDGGVRLGREPETLRLDTPPALLENVLDARGCEDLIEVPTGGDDGGSHVGTSQPLEQLHGRRKGLDALS